MRLFFSLPLLFVLVACGGSNAGVDDPTAPSPSPDPSSPSTPGDPSAPTDPPSTTTPPDPGGPRVTITMRGSTTPFAHKDAFSGETPRKQIVAVKSLWLYRSPTDTSPVKVFDHGDKAVEVELVSGKTVELAKVAAKSLPAGVFTMAKSGVSYVKYAVDARMHSGTAFGAIDGYYDNVQALSDGAVIDGAKKKKGDFKYSFVADATGATVGSLEGENAPTPVATTGGGITMDMSGPETFYVFPINMAVDPNVATDQLVDFELNVDKSFRWVDQSTPGYTAGVYDTTPTQFEPVMAFGANTFKLNVAPSK
jgi:hypothetical protein